MLNNLSSWYRTTVINRDGRVNRWEHMVLYVQLIVTPMIFVTRWYQTIWPFLIGVFVGMLVGEWSYRQDLAVHQSEFLTKKARRDPSARTPIAKKASTMVYFAVLAYVISQWITKGHY